MIAALFVLPDGPYVGVEGVDPWPESRDARTYAGPHPIVAHPPCQRWGRYWYGGPSCKVRKRLGDDDGCFAAALRSVRQFGGVLEHPAGSLAWPEFGIARPRGIGGWCAAHDGHDGRTCQVEQGHYGHRARKPTWLYVCGVADDDLPDLIWGPSDPPWPGRAYGEHEQARKKRAGAVAWLSRKERAATPPAFRDVLLTIARSVRR